MASIGITFVQSLEQATEALGDFVANLEDNFEYQTITDATGQSVSVVTGLDSSSVKTLNSKLQTMKDNYASWLKFLKDNNML